TPTRCPSVHLETPSPRASMTPATSWPGTRGYWSPGQCPFMTAESLWQTPQAATLTRTAPGGGSGIGRSTISNLWFGPASCATRIVFIVPVPPVVDAVYSASTLWTSWMQTEPSPTAAATRLTLLARTSPTANTPGRLVSNRSGGRVSDQPWARRSSGDRSGPALTKPLSSSATQPPSHSVLGDAPVIMNTWPIGCVER